MSPSQHAAPDRSLRLWPILSLALLLLSAGVSLGGFRDVQAAGSASTCALQDEPVANAGPDINTTVGAVVVLDGSASTGFEGPDALNYTWVILFAGNRTTLYGKVVQISFDAPGRADVNLTVRDSLNRTDYDLMSVVVKAPPKPWLERNLKLIVSAAVLGGMGGALAAFVLYRMHKGLPVLSETRLEKLKLARKRYAEITKQLVRNKMGLLGLIILAFFCTLAVIGPYITPYSVKEVSMERDFQLPSKEHWLGTDNFGKDIFSELLYGARTSVIVGVTSAIIASVVGAAVGLYSGYVGGWKDEVVMRLNDVVLSIPWLVLMIIVAAMIGKIDLTGIILIIGLTGWSYTARVVRAQVLSVKERQYIERARAIGSSELSIIRRHIFPNTFPLIFANTILTVAVSILSEATLSFLGFRPIGEITWGTMLSYASESSAFQIGLHWWILAPGFCIVAVVLGFTLLGYALDEILNPKLRKR